MKVCDKCRSDKVSDLKLNLVRPETGAGDRTRNAVVESFSLELCPDCVPAVWGAALGAVHAAIGKSVFAGGAYDKEKETGKGHG